MAVRTPSCSSAISPNPSPRPSVADPATVDDHLELAVRDRVVAITVLALDDDRLTDGRGKRFEAPGQPLDLGRRQRGEQPQRAEQADLDDRHVCGCVERKEPSAAEQCEQRQHDADTDRRGRRAAEVDEHRGDERPDCGAGHDQRLQDPEDAGEHVGGGRPLQ